MQSGRRALDANAGGYLTADMKDSATWIAVYGAVIATVSCIWNWIQHRRDRGMLRLEGKLGYWMHDDSRTVFALTVTNVGRRPVVVALWGADIRGGRTLFVAPHPGELPKTLTEGQYHLFTSHEYWKLVDSDVLRVWVRDSHGKRWILPRRDFARARVDAANELLKRASMSVLRAV
jgi:hypothetical protein